MSTEAERKANDAYYEAMVRRGQAVLNRRYGGDKILPPEPKSEEDE